VAALKKEELLNVAENAVRIAQQKGATEAEAYAYDGQGISIGLERGQINKSNKTVDHGLDNFFPSSIVSSLKQLFATTLIINVTSYYFPIINFRF
jgi:hypothetical protein